MLDEINWVVVAYMVMFLTGFTGILLMLKRFKKKKKKTRPPLDFVFLRAPGESLRKEIQRKNDRLYIQLVFAMVVPLAAAYTIIASISIIYPEAPAIFWIPVVSLNFIGGLSLSYVYLYRSIRGLRNLELGYSGERVVAEKLSPLERDGYRVFHDIPAASGKTKFNLDHVTVGPTGVTMIETETRSKGIARPGFKEHVVTYDGKKLIWPWGEDDDYIQQVKRQTKWLEDWIHTRTGVRVAVSPILTFPGWWVEDKGINSQIRVVSHKSICAAVQGKLRQISNRPTNPPI
ncbi:NERD domain-containing protein [Puniceicoccaceae bacterium K14]|nr:NERD domain-containing protein [Puniceicoccaceae bacterium K14]